MTQVNPPPQIILPKVLADMGIDVINYFQMQSRFDLQLWTRTGGSEDLIDDSVQDSTGTEGIINRTNAILTKVEQKINDLEQLNQSQLISRINNLKLRIDDIEQLNITNSQSKLTNLSKRLDDIEQLI